MDMDMNDNGGDSDDGGDGEGVWSPDIEQCFREALLIFPPCGRRKHILNEEGGGKMYGRNELIARHIKMRTGKTRTRKQVSSHIQVLNRRKAKAEGSSSSVGMPSPTLSMGLHPDSALVDGNQQHQHQQQGRFGFDIWADRPIVTRKIRLVEFSAFIEHPANQQNIPQLQPQQQQIPNYQQQTISNGDNNSQSGNLINDNPFETKNEQQMKQEDMSQLQSSMQRIVVSQQQQTQSSASPLHVGNVLSTPTTTAQQGSVTAPTNPLGSNLQLTAQFNQANYMTSIMNNTNSINNDSNGNHLNGSQANEGNIHNQQQHQLSNSSQYQHQSAHHIQLHHQPSVQSIGLTRHSYIKIDYTQVQASHNINNRIVESININQILDKFPDLGGSEGLFQRGQPDSFFLVKFWADIHSDFDFDVTDQNSFFGYSSHFETCEPYRDITCSTKVCSYGNPLVEKVEKIEGLMNQANGRQSFKISRSPMCDFMIEFIRKLRPLPSLTLKNSVLENFTVLQVITSESSNEILLCLAYVFEIPEFLPRNGENSTGPQYNVYKLTKD